MVWDKNPIYISISQIHVADSESLFTVIKWIPLIYRIRGSRNIN